MSIKRLPNQYFRTDWRFFLFSVVNCKGLLYVRNTLVPLTCSVDLLLSDRKELSTSGRMISLRDLFSGDDHLKGEHTVRMSPTG